RTFMSPDARLMCGSTLILIPTIVYGGLTVLGVITNGAFGAPAPKNLSPSQVAFYRAGHAHAGVLTLLALFLQIGADYAVIPHSLVWPIRIGAIAAALLRLRIAVPCEACSTPEHSWLSRLPSRWA